MRSLLTAGSKVTANRKAGGLRQARRGAAILVTLGLTWLFGVLAISDAKLVFQYLFCIFNSIQGLLVFIFYCVLSVETRTKYKALFGKDQEKDSRSGHRQNVGSEGDSRFHEIQTSRNLRSDIYTGSTGTSSSTLKHATNMEFETFKTNM